MYYRSPKKSVCADVIPYYENGTYYLFYLRDYRNIEQDGEGCPWCLLTTKDLVHYQDHGPVLLRGSEEEQDLYVFTGSVFKENDTYYIFYTGHNPHLRKKGLPEQKILLAKSKDLFHWEKVKDFVFEAPSYLEMHDFRDPFIFKDEENNRYCMLIAAREKNKNPTNSRGVTLIAYSKDLINWELDKTPFYAPRAYCTHEGPDLFKIGKYWYLAFSEFTDKILTTYRISTTPFGPWKTLKVNTFDGHAFYAAKSTSDGKRRIMFGWDPIKNNESDFEKWQWGGTIIPHELVQDESDGTLYVKCPKEILESYSNEVIINEKNVFGDVDKIINGYHLNNSGQNIISFGSLPSHYKLELDIKCLDDIGDFGIILNEHNNFDQFYKIKFEPKMNRLAMDRQPRIVEFLHNEVDVERYCPMSIENIHHVVVIAENSVLTVYVDDKYAMSGRMFDFEGGNLAIYSHNNEIEVTNIHLYK